MYRLTQREEYNRRRWFREEARYSKMGVSGVKTRRSIKLAAESPKKRPKQWNEGNGQQIASLLKSRILSPTKRSLLAILLARLIWKTTSLGAKKRLTYLCINIAAFGSPVVPLVS